MTKLLSASAFSAVLLLGAVVAFGADIVGTVADPSGAPIAGVKVSVENQAGVNVGATSSDSLGKYEFHGLQTGTYTLLSSGQSAVSYVGPQGLTVNWGVSHNASAIATALSGTSTGLNNSTTTRTLAAATIVGPTGQNGNCGKGDDGGDDGHGKGHGKCPKTPKD